MTLMSHVIVSTCASTVFAYLTKSWPGTIACFLSGIFIDLDHLLDYYLNKKKITWKMSEMEEFCMKEGKWKLYLVLHSYELMAILWIGVFVFPQNMIWLGAIVGMSVHLMLDQITNPVYPMTYFWFYRQRFNFSKEILLTGEFVKRAQRLYEKGK